MSQIDLHAFYTIKLVFTPEVCWVTVYLLVLYHFFRSVFAGSGVKMLFLNRFPFCKILILLEIYIYVTIFCQKKVKLRAADNFLKLSVISQKTMSFMKNESKTQYYSSCTWK